VTDDLIGAFTKVHPSSSLLLSIPFSSNCGGKRLNQYTITIELQWTRATPSSSAPLSLSAGERIGMHARYGSDEDMRDLRAGFGLQPDGEEEDLRAESRGNAESGVGCWPIFSLSPAPGKARRDHKVLPDDHSPTTLHRLSRRTSGLTAAGDYTPLMVSVLWVREPE
jgi:hypothetical protein